MRPKEVVHLALGAPANHVATHFFNTQEAYMEYGASGPEPLVDHDVSFRAGVGADGAPTYTPRALFFDVRAAFGTLRTHNALYGADDEDAARAAWEGDVIQTHEPVEPSWYAAQLHNEDHGLAHETVHGRPIAYWSDYARCPLHPRSLVPVGAPSLHGTSFLAPGVQAFDTFEQGHAVAQAMEKEQSILDENVRWLAEGSDLMQAFQITASASDAFAGVSAAYLAHLADEYPKTERVVFDIARAAPSDNTTRSARLRSVYAMNRVLALTSSLDLATMVVPVADVGPPTPHVHCDADDLHQWSAALATYLETATLSTRLRHAESWGRIVSQLNWRKDTKIAQLGGTFPTPLLAPMRSPADPTDALIHAMFAARSLPIDATPPNRNADAGAASLRRAWHDTSVAYAHGIRAPLAEFSSPTGPPAAPATPYAESVVARDADPLAEAPTREAIHAWNSAQPPLIHTYVALLTP